MTLETWLLLANLVASVVTLVVCAVGHQKTLEQFVAEQEVSVTPVSIPEPTPQVEVAEQAQASVPKGPSGYAFRGLPPREMRA